MNPRFEPLDNGIDVRPIVPGMGSVNLGFSDSLTQIQFKPDMIDIVTHLDPAHSVTSFDYDGNPLG